ncbi:MAG TPA: ATP-binding protein [Acholeplasmataceae bacterium]|jgi:energy-coupling factor transporter ATP-binding protein EcfA2|nr:ATP-binding protein [Acholeplasmataceae bacterium]
MKRITFITGHYGSGKSEFAVNLAIIEKVKMIVDLDIINPYFRSRELTELMIEHDISLVSSPLKEAAASDLPYIAREAYQPFSVPELTAIYDLGGDRAGARLMRQFKDHIRPEEVDLLLCVNVYRELTSSPEKIADMIRQIEESSGYKITGLINNSNFLRDTTYEDLLYGERILNEVEKRLELSIVYTGIYEDLVNKCGPLAGRVVPLKLFLRKKWL